MRRTEVLVVAALAVLALVAALLVPTYPNYDTYFHLVWGRDLLHGSAPDFQAYAAPTEHPLWIAVCALAGLVGAEADRVLVVVCVLSLVAHTMMYAAFLEDPLTWVLLGAGSAMAGWTTSRVRDRHAAAA